MARFLHRLSSSVCRKSHYIFLASAWALGLWFGVLLFRYAHGSIVSLMPAALFSRLSIVGLLGSMLLPFLFSVFAVFISCPGLLYPICLIKAVSFGYLSCAVFYAFPSSGWLIRYLFLFSDQVGLLLLGIYWQRHISGFRGFYLPSSMLYFMAFCLIAGLEYYVVSPFLRRILIL